MTRQYTLTPFQLWRERHKDDAALIRFSGQWTDASLYATRAVAIGYEAFDLHQGTKDKTPDLFKAVAEYGHALILSDDWKSSPFDGISDAEAAQFRKKEMDITLDELRSYLAGFAGGFLQVLGLAPQRFISLMVQQLEAKKAEFHKELAKPLEEWESWAEFIGERLEPYAEQSERDSFNRVFDLREELRCFLHGFERLVVLCESESAPELQLPNIELSTQMLDAVSMGPLRGFIESGDPKLKEILDFLGSQKCFNGHVITNLDDAPDEFWWRHWKVRPKKKNRNKK